MEGATSRAPQMTDWANFGLSGGSPALFLALDIKKAPAGGCFFMILRLLSDYPFREFARTIAPIGSICCSCSNISSYFGSPRFA